MLLFFVHLLHFLFEVRLCFWCNHGLLIFSRQINVADPHWEAQKKEKNKKKAERHSQAVCDQSNGQIQSESRIFRNSCGPQSTNNFTTTILSPVGTLKPLNFHQPLPAQELSWQKTQNPYPRNAWPFIWGHTEVPRLQSLNNISATR